jgi:hypothetical protein
MCSRPGTLAAIPLFLTLASAHGAIEPFNTPSFLQQFGTAGFDTASGITPLAGGGYVVSGLTSGALTGTSAGGDDFFLARYDSNGDQVWLRQYGSNDFDFASSVTTDQSGGTLVVGDTKGKLGETLFGYHDAFVARFDPDGNQLWVRQFGTPTWDVAHAVASDGLGGAMVVGVTDGDLGARLAGQIDAFLARYDDTGSLLWIEQFGTKDIDTALAVVPDTAGGALVAGVTTGALGAAAAGSHDVFLVRYDSLGNRLWARQFGTPMSDRVFTIAPDGNGGAILVGATHGDLSGTNAGRSDAFVTHFDSDGNQLWIEQFGTSGSDAATAAAPDGNGGVLVSGYTYANLGGPYAGGGDAFLAHFDRDGVQQSIRQFGSAARDEPAALADDGQGSVTVVGYTTGALTGSNAGNADIFVATFESTPCFADCDRSTGQGTLDVFDFLCFQSSFVQGESYACDCDTSTDLRVCDVFDFLCFQDAFVRGCPM